MYNYTLGLTKSGFSTPEKQREDNYIWLNIVCQVVINCKNEVIYPLQFGS